MDAVLCMYHDQGLIPLKLHAFHEGVNVTLGLPFPRTSPDHGTAFEIAGKGIARPDSMIAAIRLAVELAPGESVQRMNSADFAASISRFFSRLRSSFVWSAWQPYDRFTWWLEVAAGNYRRGHSHLSPIAVFVSPPLVYTLIALHIMLLCVGGHYTYARVPLFDWLGPYFGWHRNHFDRLGHFMQGFVPALIAREIFIRLRIVIGGWRLPRRSHLHGNQRPLRIAGMGDRPQSGAAANAFLGTQGDVWDTQQDMFMALIGALCALLFMSIWQNRQMRKIPRNW